MQCHVKCTVLSTHTFTLANDSLAICKHYLICVLRYVYVGEGGNYTLHV